MASKTMYHPELPPPGFKMIKEGTAAMIFPENEENSVFYNKVQVINRDISIQVISMFVEYRAKEMEAKKLKKAGKDMSEMENIDFHARIRDTASTDGIVILDALAASGLRSIRYLNEIPGVQRVIINDLDSTAVETAQRNVEFNQVDPTRVTIQQGDASLVMYQNRNPQNQFDVIDLDPYGSAAPFIDAAVQSVKSGGLLCITCTDMAVLSGHYAEVCYSKYWSMPTKGKYLHEMALRTLLYAIDKSANRYGRYIAPILSLSIDFYIRVFVRVFSSPQEVKNSCLKSAYVFQSIKCPTFFIQPVAKTTDTGYGPATGPVCSGTCPQTGSKFRIGGPIWSNPIFDHEWIQQILDRLKSNHSPFPIQTKKRISGILTSVLEELPDVPLYYLLPDLCETVHCGSLKMNVLQAAIRNAGYRVSLQHREPQAIKTDAPVEIIWDIMRCWVKQHPVNERHLKNLEDPGTIILSKEPSLEVDFTLLQGSIKQVRRTVARYPPNPESFWGPKARAVGKKRKLASNEIKEENNNDHDEDEDNDNSLKNKKQLKISDDI